MTHMLRCARPISRQRTTRVRLRSSIFACLASEVFLSSAKAVLNTPLGNSSTFRAQCLSRDPQGIQILRIRSGQALTFER